MLRYHRNNIYFNEHGQLIVPNRLSEGRGALQCRGDVQDLLQDGIGDPDTQRRRRKGQTGRGRPIAEGQSNVMASGWRTPVGSRSQLIKEDLKI